MQTLARTLAFEDESAVVHTLLELGVGIELVGCATLYLIQREDACVERLYGSRRGLGRDRMRS